MLIDATILGNRTLNAYRVQKFMSGKCMHCKGDALNVRSDKFIREYLKTGYCGSCQEYYRYGRENRIN